MLKLLVVTLLATAALADVSSIFDHILAQARNRVANSIPYRPLHYASRTFNLKTRNYTKVYDFWAGNGHLLLGKFQPDGTPVLYGNSTEGQLESRFLIDLKVKYDNFKAINFTSGEVSDGSMIVSYDVAEINTRIKMSKDGSQCLAEVTTYTPTFMSDPVAVFTSSSPDLAQNLFSRAVSTLNFYLNHTLVEEGLPAFDFVVTKSTTLCTLLQ